MSALVEVLYPVPDLRRTPLTLLRWWESRRLLYNQVVGTTGLFTLAAVWLLAPGAVAPNPRELAMAAVAYGLVANVCYSAGWALELLTRMIWGSRAPRIGPLLFREGLIFSVGLTLLPVLLSLLFQVARLVTMIVP
jgi:hypothetical protein